MLYDKRWTKTAPQIKPVPIEPWRRLLLKAANVLKREGWCQRTMYDGLRVCAVGAMMRADGWVPSSQIGYVQTNAYVAAHRHLKQHIATSSIEAWNDRSGRTAAEVIATLRKVAGA